MKNDRTAFLCVLGVLCGSIAFVREPGAARRRSADFVLLDALVYTVDSTNPRAQAVVVAQDRIVYVGANDSARTYIGPNTQVLHLAGRMVLPGFEDTHVHPVTGGIELGECDLNAAETLADLRRTIGECARRNPKAAWVRGGGWALPIFPAANPSRLLLDSLVPDRPAYFTAADGHSAWVNSRALAIGGVTRTTRDPANGRIERDATGAPSGTLRESAADLVSNTLPRYTADDYLAGLRRGFAMASRFGITTVHEAAATQPVALAYARAASMGLLPARAVVSLLVETNRPVASEVQRLAALRARIAGGLVRPISAKIFMDGVIEAHTAALLAPYLDSAGYRGMLNVAPEKFDAFAAALNAAGFKVHVHAIGDRAIRVALDGFERQRARDPGHSQRNIIAHIQLFDPADVPRFAQLGVVADFQPLWAYRDSYIRDLTEPKLGPERSRWTYPIASVVKTGAIVAAGSDWSVSSMNPLEAIQVGVTRRAPTDPPGDAWLPQERVDLATMIRLYTLGGAQASDDEAENGSLTAGKLADLIVLSDDLFSLPPHRISSARVLLTMMGGRVVYRDSTLTADAAHELDAFNVRLADAYRKHDAAAYAALFTDSAVFEWPAIPNVRGRAALEGMARELWPPLKNLDLKVIPSSRRVSGDHAAEFGAFEESWDDDKGRNTEYGRYAAALVRRDGTWLLDRWMGFEDSSRVRATR